MRTKLQQITLTLFAALMLLGASPAFADPVNEAIESAGETIDGYCSSAGGTNCPGID